MPLDQKAQPLLQHGSRDHIDDHSVEDWQRILDRLGFPPGPTDGIFGVRTEAATKTLQRATEIVVDGVVGPRTRAAAEELDHRATTPENLIRGIDVSSHQGEITWPLVAASGIEFAILKATEGATLTDPLFAKNWKGARGLVPRIGVYHYFKAITSTPEEQAAHFLEVYRSVPGTADLPPAIDVEEIGRGQSSEDLVQRVLAFAEIVEAELGVVPMLYTYTNFAINQFSGSHANGLARFPPWLACFRERPEVPPPWSIAGKTWLAWQQTDKGRCDGIAGGVDLDILRPDMLAT